MLQSWARPRRPLLVFAAGALITLTVFGQMPGNIKLSGVMQDTMHFPVFFTLALIFLQFCKGLPGRTFLACLMTGIAIELIQGQLGGDASLKDVGTDVLGTLAGLSSYAYLRGKRRGRPLAIATLCMGIALAPLAWALAAYGQRDLRFPVLGEFHSPLDRFFFKSGRSELSLHDAALRVHIRSPLRSGVSLYEPYPNWSGYQTLRIDLANPDPAPLSLTVRVHDAGHDQQDEDRFNRTFTLPASSRETLSIPLAQIRVAPRGRQMDMKHIAAVVIVAGGGNVGRTFLVYQIRLE